MRNKYFITGATGFVGSNITHQLVNRGEDVSIFVRDRNLNWRLNGVKSKVRIFEGNLLDKSIFLALKKSNPDYIFHLASYGIPPHEDDIYKMIDVNLKGTINIIEAAKKIDFKLFINTGSCFEYGSKKNKMRETDYLEPTNNYSVVKSAVSLYCKKEAIRSNLPIITLRLFTPYGNYESGYRLIPSIILDVLQDRPIKVSTPQSVRDFIFIEDVINAYIQATMIKVPNGSIFNIGSGKQNTIKDIVETILKTTNSKSKVVWGGVKRQARYLEPQMLEADLSHTKKILKWKPNYSLEEGIKRTVDWFYANKTNYS